MATEPRLFVRLAAAVLCTVPVGYGLLQAGRLAYTDRVAGADTLGALIVATRLEPADADYPARIATVDPSRADQLSAALRLNPNNSSWWIMQAVHDEETGDSVAAETHLLKATSMSRLYKARWTAAFFYYRQGKVPQFVQWARAALLTGYGDANSLFRMAGNLGLAPAAILRDIVPGDPETVAGFLNFSSQNGNPEPAYEPALKLIDLGARQHRDELLRESEALLQSNPAHALELWNRMTRAGWLHWSQIDPAAGKVLARTDFRGDRLQLAFDWKYLVPGQLRLSTAELDGSLRVDFSGSEPESFEIARQHTVLLPKRNYRLKVLYRGASLMENSGLQWTVATISTGKDLAALPLANRTNSR